MYNKKSVVFPVFNNGCISWCWRVAWHCWGAEEAVKICSHLPATWWKKYSIQSSTNSATWAPLPAVWKSMSRLLNHEN